jgi:ABC-type antimicrobial peptide transport system permease subunit
MPIYHVVTLREEIDSQLAGDRLLAVLARLFAAMAAVLASVGLYGVLVRSVAARRREFGIRLALGARPSTIARLVARDTAAILGVGVTLGTVASVALAKYLESRLFEVQASDPASAAAAVLLLAAVAAVATQPAVRRASRIDPAEAIRD